MTFFARMRGGSWFAAKVVVWSAAIGAYVWFVNPQLSVQLHDLYLVVGVTPRRAAKVA
jgi:hypothetical protein